MFLENKNKKIAQGMGSTRSARRAPRYEKARQDVGLFFIEFCSTKGLAGISIPNFHMLLALVNLVDSELRNKIIELH